MGEAPRASEQVTLEEISLRRPSLQAAGGVAEEQEGEGPKPHEEAGSVDSEQVTTETDGEEGTPLSITQCSLFAEDIFFNSHEIHFRGETVWGLAGFYSPKGPSCLTIKLQFKQSFYDFHHIKT